jgi:Dolichyl-phosphate-mannose-protein mannosyltransferase
MASETQVGEVEANGGAKEAAGREGVTAWWKSGTAAVVGTAVGTVAVHLATGWRYGFDRDELMALEDARHLAWGYVAYPPMTAFFGRVALELFGTSLEGFRFFAAVVQALAVVLTGLMAKELGGGRWAQVVAALAGVPFCLGGGALMQYISFDFVCWVLTAYCMIRVLRSGRCDVEAKRKGRKEARREVAANSEDLADMRPSPSRLRVNSPEPLRRVGEEAGGDARWWVGVGAGIGLGMVAKYTMAFLAGGVVAGVLLTDARRYLKSKWLWMGAGLAALLVLPNLIWQVRRNFVSLEFLRFLHERDVRTGVTDWFLAGQFELTLLAFPLAVAGLWFYFFADEGRRCRAVGWMYAVPLALFLLMRGRDYYLAPAYPMLYAAGAVWVERKWRVEAKTQGGKEVRRGVPVEESRRQDLRGAGWSDNAGTSSEDLAVMGSSSAGPLRGGEAEDGGVNPVLPKQAEIRAAQEEKADSSGKPGPRNDKLGDGWRWVEIRARMVRAVIGVALAVDVAIAGAVALPLAPINSAWWKFAVKVDGVFPEEVGWPEFVGTVAQVRDRLPANERERLGILAGNYGEVGALNLYGEKYGLPRAISGVNSSWERGYGNPTPETVIVVGFTREFLEKHFASCELAARTWNRWGVANEETVENPDIFVCRGLKGSWEEFWKKIKGFA